MRSASVVLVAMAFAVSACSSSTTATEAVKVTELAAIDESTTTITDAGVDDQEPVEPPELPLGFMRCDDLASTGVVDGPLSDDPEIAADQQWRADNGLRSDLEWVTEVPNMVRETPEAHAFDAPLTDDEVTELTTRGGEVDFEVMSAYRQAHEATFGGYWLDHTTRSPTISFTTDVEQRRHEVNELMPGVRVVKANATEAELIALQDELVAQLVERGIGSGSGVYIQIGGGRVGLSVLVLDDESVEAVAEFADPALVCLNGQEVDGYTPPGPQTAQGDGWRLLGLREVDLPFQLISDESTFESAWSTFAPTEPAPSVDFGTEVVVSLPTSGRGIVNGPCGSRFDGWRLVGDVIELDLPSPGGQTGCELMYVPGSYLIALDSTGLAPGPVTISVVSKQLDEPLMSRTFDR